MKRFLIVALALVMVTGMAFGQEIRASKLPTTVVIGTGAEATTNPAYVDLLVTTTELPVTFVRMAADGSGAWTVDGQMSVGASYVLMYGRGKLETDGSVSGYRPFFFGGPVVAFDAVASGNTVAPGVTVGGVLGLGPMSGIVGYDLLGKKTVIGIGLKIDILTISDITTVVLKKYTVKQ